MRMYLCSNCGEKKAKEDFYHSSNKIGRQHKCKKCSIDYQKEYIKKNRQKHIESVRRYRAKPGFWERSRIYGREYSRRPEVKKRRRERDLLRTYGLTSNEYTAIFNNQKGRCGICNEILLTNNGNYRNLMVDHNHKTGQVRGLLCARCNLKLGFVEDAEWLKKAKIYLKNKDKG